MNVCVLIGRITDNVELRKTNSNKSVVQNTIAVQSKLKNNNGEYQTNFINFVAFGQTADLIAQYFQKGDRIGLTGEWNVRTYQAKDGTNRRVDELLVNNIEFLQQKREVAPTQSQTPTNEEPQQRYNYDDLEDDLPF